MLAGFSDPDKTCYEDIPVCDIDPEVTYQPKAKFQAPKHPKDRKTASQKVVQDEL